MYTLEHKAYHQTNRSKVKRVARNSCTEDREEPANNIDASLQIIPETPFEKLKKHVARHTCTEDGGKPISNNGADVHLQKAHMETSKTNMKILAVKAACSLLVNIQITIPVLIYNSNRMQSKRIYIVLLP